MPKKTSDADFIAGLREEHRSKPAYQAEHLLLRTPPAEGGSSHKSLDQMLAEHGRKAGQISEVEIDRLVEVPGRRRHLSAEQFAELKKNLASHPLTSAITVRELPDGRLEIIAGHNRVQCYRELGRLHIRADVLALDEQSALVMAFYSNLLSPSLPDFEKYEGFIELTRRFGKSQMELANDAGISESHISRIFSFGKLPADAIALLEAAGDKSLLGSDAATKLAMIAERGGQGRVVEGIRKLIEGELSQKGAVAYAGEHKPAPRKRESVPILRGRQKWCEVVRTGKDVRLQFTDTAAVDDALMSELIAFLKSRSAVH